MILKMYSLYDNATKAFAHPFFMNTDNEAIRAVASLTTEDDHALAKHPADYSLFLVGEWDSTTGTIDNFNGVTTNLGSALAIANTFYKNQPKLGLQSDENDTTTICED